MKGRLSFRVIATVVLTLGLITLGALNVREKRRFAAPDDGVVWTETATGGVQALRVASAGPGETAGIQAGDVLLGIDGTEVRTEIDVAQALYGLGAWSRATYQLDRGGAELETTVIVGQRQETFAYLEIVGLLHLLVGLVIVTRRRIAPQAVHFYFVCLVAFVLYVFSYTGELNLLDWAVYWCDLGAAALLPPLLVHFCLVFPRRSAIPARHPFLLPVLYLPGLALGLAEAATGIGLFAFRSSTVLFQDLLYTLDLLYFGGYLLAAAGILLLRSLGERDPERVQQMKWVTRGTLVAAVLFLVFRALPRLAGWDGSGIADASLLSLSLIPVSFGWAVTRYRLSDVDILFKRGAAYTLAGVVVLGLYLTVAVSVGRLFGEGVPGLGVAGEIIATIVAALLFAPIKERVQIRLDRFFYKDRYDLRVTAKEFGRSLGSEIDLPTLLGRVMERLSASLLVDRMAVFLEDPGEKSRFVLAKAQGLEMPEGSVVPFLTKEPSGRCVVDESPEAGGLSYFIPCRAKGRVIAYLGLGRTRAGEYLTTEDLDLLEGVSDYVGIAMENAQLYRSLEERAVEYQDLKDFSENIVESISVGVMVEVDGRVVGWNRALERLTGLDRTATVGKRTSEVLPEPSLDRLRMERNLYKHRWGNLVVNFYSTSLVDKEGRTSGRLIIVDDITERVRLEDQLVQNDKLTSIGLLAAGVAHEVNTPLAVISSYSQLLRKRLSPSDERTKLTEKIIQQTFRASEIVNNLLNFSRTNATEFGELDIHEVIADTLSLLDHQLQGAGVTIERKLEAEAPLVFANAGKIQQVFLNLFLNAKDAMAGGGRLVVRTDKAENSLRIWVGDTGAGMGSEIVRKIYDPFFTTKEVGKGTGLGLSVSYGIIQEHGGNISVESEPGKGTTFRIELPLARKPVSV